LSNLPHPAAVTALNKVERPRTAGETQKWRTRGTKVENSRHK